MVVARLGNNLTSRLIGRAHAEPGFFLYAPVCALVEADRVYPGTAEHIAALPGITVVDLDLPAALAVAAQTPVEGPVGPRPRPDTLTVPDNGPGLRSSSASRCACSGAGSCLRPEPAPHRPQPAQPQGVPSAHGAPGVAAAGTHIADGPAVYFH